MIRPLTHNAKRVNAKICNFHAGGICKASDASPGGRLITGDISAPRQTRDNRLLRARVSGKRGAEAGFQGRPRRSRLLRCDTGIEPGKHLGAIFAPLPSSPLTEGTRGTIPCSAIMPTALPFPCLHAIPCRPSRLRTDLCFLGGTCGQHRQRVVQHGKDRGSPRADAFRAPHRQTRERRRGSGDA